MSQLVFLTNSIALCTLAVQGLLGTSSWKRGRRSKRGRSESEKLPLAKEDANQKESKY